MGDRVVTSGHANAFPADLPIGTIASVQDGVIRVQLFAEGMPIDYVRIVDYGLQGIIRDAAASVPSKAGKTTARTAGPSPTAGRSADRIAGRSDGQGAAP